MKMGGFFIVRDSNVAKIKLEAETWGDVADLNRLKRSLKSPVSSFGRYATPPYLWIELPLKNEKYSDGEIK